MGEIDDLEKDQSTNSEGENEANWLDELGHEPTNLLKNDLNDQEDIGSENQKDDEPPEWLEGDLAQDMPEEESVPDWLRDEISAGVAEQVDEEIGDDDLDTTAIYDRAPAIPEENIPDWLRDQQPAEGSAVSEEEKADDLSWLDQIAAGAGAAIDEPPTLSWDEADEEAESQEESAGEEDMTWLDDMGTLPGIMPAELADINQESPESDSMLTEDAVQAFDLYEAAQVSHEDIEESLEPASGESPEFLVEPSEEEDGMVEDVPEDPDEAIAWLEQLAARQGAREEELPTLSEDTAPSPALDSNEIPEDPDEAMAWLEKMAAEQDQQDQELLEDFSEDALESVDMVGEVAAETVSDDELDQVLSGLDELEMPDDFDEALSWLEDMVAEPKPEVAARDDESPFDEPVEEFSAEGDLEPVLDETESMAELESESLLEVTDFGEIEVEEDSEDAMAWLEQLAARQGADIEELTTVDSADEVVAETPEWLRQELDEALDEAAEGDVVGLEAAAAGYSLEKLLEAEELDAETSDLESAPEVEFRDLSQESESELVDQVISDLEAAEEMITESEFLEDVAAEMEAEAEELEADSQDFGAEAALLANVAEDMGTVADLEDATETELDVEATIFQSAAEDLQAESIELEVEAIISEDEAGELESEAEALKLEAEAKMADAEELILEIEAREADSMDEVLPGAESDLADMFGEQEASAPEILDTEGEIAGPESQPQVDEELAWLETLGKVDADSWLEAEAEASSPDMVVPEALAGLDSSFDATTEIEVEEKARALFGDAENVLDSEYLNSARQAMAGGELDSALDAYNNLLEQGEGLPYLIAELEYSIDSYGQEPLLQRLLGDTYVRNGQLRKAVEVYRQALDNI